MKFSDIEIPTTDRKRVDMSDHWGEGAVVYVREATPADHQRVARDPNCKGWPFEPTLAGSIYLLTIICQDEAGEQFFDNPVADRKTLAKQPMSVLGGLLSAIGDVELDESEAEKN